jgi:8-amino-7-oxononanoate synthase
MLTFDNYLGSEIAALQADNNLRELNISNPSLVDFTSNDYLGLARNQQLAAIVDSKLKTLSPQLMGSTGSRLLSGNFEYTESVEKKLASIFKSEAALIFNSGYNANLAVLSSIPKKNDLILYDQLVHASIKDGIRLSFATRHPFKHNDISDLEGKLRRAGHQQKYIVVESIYSMNGDTCPLKDYVELAEKYNASIILDEAHSTGVMGENGNGLANSLGLQTKIAIRIHTFGKAIGTHGACIAGSNLLIQYLINTARSFIYTTALPLHTIATIDCAFEFLKANQHLQSTLSGKIDLFIENIQSVNRVKSSSAIQCIQVKGNLNAKKAARFLQENNFDVRAILSPTVAKDSERLRICLHAFNTDSEIKSLAKLIDTAESQNHLNER